MTTDNAPHVSTSFGCLRCHLCAMRLVASDPRLLFEIISSGAVKTIDPGRFLRPNRTVNDVHENAHYKIVSMMLQDKKDRTKDTVYIAHNSECITGTTTHIIVASDGTRNRTVRGPSYIGTCKDDAALGEVLTSLARLAISLLCPE